MQLLRHMTSKAHGILCDDRCPWSYLQSLGVCGYWDCPSWNRIVDLNHSHSAKQWSPPHICRISTNWFPLIKYLTKLKRILLVPRYFRHKRLTCLSSFLYFSLSSVGTFLFCYFPMSPSLQIEFEQGLVHVYHSWGGLVVDPNGIRLFPIIFAIAQLNKTVGLVSCHGTNFCQRPSRCSAQTIWDQKYGCSAGLLFLTYAQNLSMYALRRTRKKYGKLYYDIDAMYFSLFVMVAGVSFGENMTNILR